MQLPSKLNRYSESVLMDMVKVLSEISYPIGIYDLYKLVKQQIKSLDRYIEALDCLFILEKITFDYKAGVVDVIGN